MCLLFFNLFFRNLNLWKIGLFRMGFSVYNVSVKMLP